MCGLTERRVFHAESCIRGASAPPFPRQREAELTAMAVRSETTASADTLDVTTST